MACPTQPITLNVPEIESLSRHFSSFRHDVNGCLSLMVAAMELIRYNPDVVKRMAGTLIEQPPKIAGKVNEFVNECERVLTIRNADEPSWYPAMSPWVNALAISPTGAVTAEGENIKSLHTELL